MGLQTGLSIVGRKEEEAIKKYGRLRIFSVFVLGSICTHALNRTEKHTLSTYHKKSFIVQNQLRISRTLG